MFSINSLPNDIIRYIITFIPLQSLAWSRALTLQSIKDNGGLETVIFKDHLIRFFSSPLPFHVLNAIVGERTRTLILQNIDEIMFYNLQFLNMPNLHTLEIRMQINNDVKNLKLLQCLRPKSLYLDNFQYVSSLEPLRDMRPESLHLHYFKNVSSLEPLRDMHPENLYLNYFPNVSSLEPLRDMRPKSLYLNYFPNVSSLEPLRKMNPERLRIDNFAQIKELKPIYDPQNLFVNYQRELIWKNFTKQL